MSSIVGAVINLMYNVEVPIITIMGILGMIMLIALHIVYYFFVIIYRCLVFIKHGVEICGRLVRSSYTGVCLFIASLLRLARQITNNCICYIIETYFVLVSGKAFLSDNASRIISIWSTMVLLAVTLMMFFGPDNLTADGLSLWPGKLLGLCCSFSPLCK